MFTREDRSSFPYWFAHWAAYQMTALNCKAWKFKYLFHDMEKPFLRLFLPYEKVQLLHRTYHNHHPEWLENHLEAYSDKLTDERIKKFLNRFDYEGAIIDWECSHFTKEACKLNAHDEYKKLLTYVDFYEKYPNITFNCYNEFSKRLMDAIKKLGLENEK